jgi:hypothetical protein
LALTMTNNWAKKNFWPAMRFELGTPALYTLKWSRLLSLKTGTGLPLIWGFFRSLLTFIWQQNLIIIFFNRNDKLATKKRFTWGRIWTHNLRLNFKRFVYIPNFLLQLLIPFVNTLCHTSIAVYCFLPAKLVISN